MRKFYTALAGLAIILAVFITTASAYEHDEIVFDFTVIFTDDGHTTNVYTNAVTVEEFLQSVGINPRPQDIIMPHIDTHIRDGMRIEIVRALHVFITLDGSPAQFTAHARPGSTLSTFVMDYRNETGREYLFDMAQRNRILEAGDFIELSSVNRLRTYEEQDLPYEREYVESDRLFIGEEQVYRAGVPGRQRTTSLSVYVGGVQNNHVTLSTQVLSEPINAVVHVGTALPPYHAMSADGEIFRYARRVSMESTAYTLSQSCTGRSPDHPLFGVTASGMQAQVGVVAVDTNVIPFHTRLYIEGYGFAVAGDRGGAIRGYKVDVFLNSMEEVRQWGRRHNVQVWILDEESEFPLVLIPR